MIRGNDTQNIVYKYKTIWKDITSLSAHKHERNETEGCRRTFIAPSKRQNQNHVKSCVRVKGKCEQQISTSISGIRD